MGMLTGYRDPTVDSTVEMPVDVPLPRRRPLWPQTVIKQYANSPRILSLIESFADAMNPETLTETFIDAIWDIDTCGTYGLDFWGRVVNVKRTLYVPGGQTGNLFGFAEEGVGVVFGFNQWPFNSSNTLTPNYRLEDDDYRRLILVKAFSNIADRSIPTMNAAMLQLFPDRGNVFVADLGDMTAAFVFGFQPTNLDLAILLQSGAFATPSGVLFSTRIQIPGELLGFAEQGSSVGTFATGTFNS